MSEQTSTLPYYCSRCGSHYDVADKLLACLSRHEAHDTLARQQSVTRIEVTIS